MSATLASNGSPTARRATMSKSQSQENNRMEDEKGPAHKVCFITGASVLLSLILSVETVCYRVARLSVTRSILKIFCLTFANITSLLYNTTNLSS